MFINDYNGVNSNGFHNDDDIPLTQQKNNGYNSERDKEKKKKLMMIMTRVMTGLNSTDVDNDSCNGSESQRCWEHVARWTDTSTGNRDQDTVTSEIRKPVTR